ncbi:MAG: FAD-dependent oxidoreductase [Rubripirellula sp.]
MTTTRAESGLCRKTSVEMLQNRTTPWDLAIIGGGATGVGVALDAASRGLSVTLIEQVDFGKGTSSRSTKLVHGGVRYLEQGNITLVRDALRERTRLRNNAPHLVHDMPFLIPCRSWWQRFYFGIGLKVYDFLSVRNSFGKSGGVSLAKAVASIPTLSRNGIRGGVVYHDGQFDDTRLLINMARTASDHGACLVNYMTATSLVKDDQGHVTGLVARDRESGADITVNATCVINAGGPFCDAVREMDDPKHQAMIAPSQGVHLVLPKAFFPGDMALIVPKTSDGRVLFMIPWHECVIVGTTDTAIPKVTLEPVPQAAEIEFLLKTTGEYLDRQPTIDDVLSVFTGIRPLVKGDKSSRTASLSRDHVIKIDDSGLVTITGGKWTTVRKMAEDCVDHACASVGLDPGQCVTKDLKLHGWTTNNSGGQRSYYGADLVAIDSLESERPELAEPLDPSLSIRGSDVVWATRHEMARTIEDVLARRARSLFLNSRASIQIAPRVAELMASELGEDDAWVADQVDRFQAIAAVYLPSNIAAVTSVD